jgi:hypothetical protein
MADAYPKPKDPRFKDLTGQVFGRLTVISYHGKRKKSTCWLCRCLCGKSKVVQASNLVQGTSQSCGCLRAEMMAESKTVHGYARVGKRHPMYNIWVDIRRRCYTKSSSQYRHWGGKGVRMCDRWLNGEDGLTGFECFLADMGERPSLLHSVDRYPDKTGNYEKSNCRWATDQEQNNNRANNRIVEYDGRSMTLQQAIRLCGLKEHTVRDRLRMGWTAERALTQPVLKRNWRGFAKKPKTATT